MKNSTRTYRHDASGVTVVVIGRHAAEVHMGGIVAHYSRSWAATALWAMRRSGRPITRPVSMEGAYRVGRVAAVPEGGRGA
jgi:hypothetical protein